MGKHLKEVSYPINRCGCISTNHAADKVPDDLRIDNRHLVALYSKKQTLS